MKEFYNIDFDTILSERIDTELVIINLSTGCYYNLNPTASYLWTLAANGLNHEVIIQNYATVYGKVIDDARNEIETVFDNLILFGLLTLSTEIQNKIQTQTDAPQYVKPLIEKFDDMKEMLLLDPIHEVTEKGWPYRSDE